MTSNPEVGVVRLSEDRSSLTPQCLLIQTSWRHIRPFVELIPNLKQWLNLWTMGLPARCSAPQLSSSLSWVSDYLVASSGPSLRPMCNGALSGRGCA